MLLPRSYPYGLGVFAAALLYAVSFNWNMAVREGRYLQRCFGEEYRRCGFSTSGVWYDGKPLTTQLLNAYTLLIPSGERFIIRSCRRYLSRIAPELGEELERLFFQEGSHSREHGRLLKAMRADGLSLDSFRKFVEWWSYHLLEPLTPPKLHLATAAAIEHHNAVIASFFLDQELLKGVRTGELRRLFLWHFAEEIEHKETVFKLLQSISRSWTLRALGLLFSFSELRRKPMTKTIEKFAAGMVFTLVSASSIWLIMHRYIYQKPVEVHMKLPEKVFSPDYFTARQRFREIVTTAGGRLETIPLEAHGPSGEGLGIDIAWFGAANPRSVLLHSSGLHGVEGFAGSAIQLQLVNDLPTIPKDAALIVAHVLNPYGMSWLRRFNENNVDLNRNFLRGGAYAGAPDTYANLDSFLNPQSPPTMDLYTLRAGWLVLRHGMPALKVAVVGGQYEYPKGLFFGGKRLEEVSEKYQAFLAQRLTSVERLVAIDVHTGIGNYREDILMVEPKDYAVLRPMFGERVVPPDPEKSDSYPVRGALNTMFARAMPKAKVFALTQEFGTYSATKVLHALREENRWHYYGAGTLDHPAKRILKETFCPQDETWRESVLKRGRELLNQALLNLQ